MSKKNLWEDSISENFYEESDDSYVEDTDYDFSDIDYGEYQEEEEEEFVAIPRREVKTPYNLNTKQKEVVSEAAVRLEQARLYDMLIKHDMFDGVDADQVAIAKVKKEIKDFIVERLEVLMGIRQDRPKTRDQLTVELPFNSVEVEFLKALSYKGTQGMSASSNTESAKAPVTVNKVEDKSAPARKGLKPLQAAPAPKIEKKELAPQPHASKMLSALVAKKQEVKVPVIEEEEDEIPIQEVKKERVVTPVKKKELKKPMVKITNPNLSKEIQSMANDILKTSIRNMSKDERADVSSQPDGMENLKRKAYNRAIEVFKAAKEEQRYRGVNWEDERSIRERNKRIKTNKMEHTANSVPLPPKDSYDQVMTMHYMTQRANNSVEQNMRHGTGGITGQTAAEQNILRSYGRALQGVVDHLTKK